MDNRIYLVGSEKGGVGKTSTAFNLAVLRAKAGYQTMLIDADKQDSATAWASMRAEGGFTPPLICVQKRGKMGLDLVQLRTNYEVIVDAGGVDSIELRQGIGVADRWIIPVSVGQLDLFSLAKMAQLLNEVHERIGHRPDTNLFLNAVPASTTEGEEARAMIAENETLPRLLNAQLGDRVAMRRAVVFGCGVTELTGKNANGTATAEILALYEEVFGEAYREQD